MLQFVNFIVMSSLQTDIYSNPNENCRPFVTRTFTVGTQKQ